MNCELSGEYIMKHLDRELNDIESAQLKQHLRVCGKCSRDFEDLDEIADFLNNGCAVQPPQDFELKVMERIEAMEVSRKKKVEKILFAAFSIATTLLVGLLFFLAISMEGTILDFMRQAGEHSDAFNNMYVFLREVYAVIEIMKGIILEIGIIFNRTYPIFIVLASMMLGIAIEKGEPDVKLETRQNGH